jgi:hypothetical protein
LTTSNALFSDEVQWQASRLVCAVHIVLDIAPVPHEVQSNPITGATGGWSDRNSERGADLGGSKASELWESYLSDVPRIHGEAAEQVG